MEWLKNLKQKHINRFSAYLTFVPRERQIEEIRLQRIQGYYDGISCSHYADRFEPKKYHFISARNIIKEDFVI